MLVKVRFTVARSVVVAVSAFVHVYLTTRVSQQKCTSQGDYAVAVSSVPVAGTLKVM
jgi:hypothetical protein